MRRFIFATAALLPLITWIQPVGEAAARTSRARAAVATDATADAAPARRRATRARGSATTDAAAEPAAARPRAARARAAAPADAPAPTRAARPATPAQEAQRQRMRDCNAEARTRSLSGPTRSAFMRPCLGGHPPAAGAAN